jgi:hypothetical protein
VVAEVATRYAFPECVQKCCGYVQKSASGRSERARVLHSDFAQQMPLPPNRPAAAVCDDFWREKAPGGYASAEGASSFPIWGLLRPPATQRCTSPGSGSRRAPDMKKPPATTARGRVSSWKYWVADPMQTVVRAGMLRARRHQRQAAACRSRQVGNIQKRGCWRPLPLVFRFGWGRGLSWSYVTRPREALRSNCR